MEIHHKIAGIIIRNRKLLMCRKYDEPHFIMPGGRVREGESIKDTLRRELQEELNVKLVSMRKFKTWDAEHFMDKGKIVRMETYFAEIKKTLSLPHTKVCGLFGFSGCSEKSESCSATFCILKDAVYFSDIRGEPEATNEINELAWADSDYKDKGLKIASINEDCLVPELKKRDLID